MVNREMIENALEMAIEDNIDVDDDIFKDELKEVRKRFLQLFDILIEDANDFPEE